MISPLEYYYLIAILHFRNLKIKKLLAQAQIMEKYQHYYTESFYIVNQTAGAKINNYVGHFQRQQWRRRLLFAIAAQKKVSLFLA
jgi:hypothetical protein